MITTKKYDLSHIVAFTLLGMVVGIASVSVVVVMAGIDDGKWPVQHPWYMVLVQYIPAAFFCPLAYMHGRHEERKLIERYE